MTAKSFMTFTFASLMINSVVSNQLMQIRGDLECGALILLLASNKYLKPNLEV
jgi:hypothetical protein